MSANPRLFVATRKGVFTVDRRKGRPGARWSITRAHFLADNASMVLPDRRDGWVYTALGHGHFGVKMHRSPNGGRTWEPCATPAYPPRPEGADDNHTGDLLAFGTTTGSLWVSENQGDSWETVSEHLPPTYCVRFA